jgi:hypothetical protein
MHSMTRVETDVGCTCASDKPQCGSRETQVRQRLRHVGVYVKSPVSAPGASRQQYISDADRPAGLLSTLIRGVPPIAQSKDRGA